MLIHRHVVLQARFTSVQLKEWWIVHNNYNAIQSYCSVSPHDRLYTTQVSINNSLKNGDRMPGHFFNCSRICNSTLAVGACALCNRMRYWVSQATHFTERKSLVALQPLSCRRGMQLSNYCKWLENEMLTSAKHIIYMCNCHSMTTDAIKKDHGSDWSHQVSTMTTTWWLQGDQTFPLCKGCGLREQTISTFNPVTSTI